MKKNSLIFLNICLILSTSFVFLNDPKPTLEIGKEAPLKDVKMKDVSGKQLAIKDLVLDKGVLVVFSCNTCPFVIGNNENEGWEGRYNDIAEAANTAGVGMLLINSNEAKREKGDSFDDMVQRAAEQSYNMPYVIDINNVMADAFGARTTPHIFLFDHQLKLVYKGAIDNSHESASRVKEHWLENALEQLSKGEKLDPETTRNIGCSIKRIKS